MGIPVSPAATAAAAAAALLDAYVVGLAFDVLM